MLHALGTTAVDPHVQALFERETSEAPPMKPLAPVTRIFIAIPYH